MKLKLAYRKTYHAPPIERFANSDWASDSIDRKSSIGLLFKCYENTVFRHQGKTVALSSTEAEAEYMALGNTCTEAIWLKNIVNDIGIKIKEHEDNHGAIFNSRNPKDHKRTKHIGIKHCFIRDKIEEGAIV